jgi:AcrR family transcriptional regulator
VAAAKVLYFQQGIAEVKMSHVAHYARLPESTLHQHFPDKAALVEAVVDAHVQGIYEELCRHKECSRTVVEELLALRNWASEQIRRSVIPFFQQLATDYPTGQLRLRSTGAFPWSKPLCSGFSLQRDTVGELALE